MPYRALFFDLFGTLVLFKPKVPTISVAGTTWRSTMHWLQEHVERELPGVSYEDFIASMVTVTEEIVRARPPEYREVLSHERFARALERIAIRHPDPDALARRLSLRHMDHLAASTETPGAHVDLLRRLAGRYQTALISNFDHAPTARRVLDDHGLAPFLKATLISADFGRRKPHPAIFHAALEALGTDASETLYIGDTLADDVAGARAAGMDAVWINPSGAELQPGSPQPAHTIARLTDLSDLLASLE